MNEYLLNINIKNGVNYRLELPLSKTIIGDALKSQ